MFHGTGKQKVLTEFMIMICKDTSVKRRLLRNDRFPQYTGWKSSGICLHIVEKVNFATASLDPLKHQRGALFKDNSFSAMRQNCYQTFSSSGVWHLQDAAAF